MKFMKNELEFRKKTQAMILSCAVILILIVSIICIEISRETKKSIEDFVKDDIIGISVQNAIIVRRELDEKQRLLQALVDDIENSRLTDEHEILKKLEVYVSHYNFYNMGILYPDGMCHKVDGEILDLSETDYYKESYEGEFLITESLLSEGKEEILLNVLLAPIIVDGEVELVITATYRSNDFAELLNIKSFQSEGESVIINSEGESVLTLQDYSNKEYSDMLQFIDSNPELRPSEESEDENYFSFTYKGREYLSYMEKIGIKDWYLMSYVDKEEVFANVWDMEKGIIIHMVLSAAIVIVVLLILLYVYNRYQKKLQKMVFYDELLGEKNYEYLKLYFRNMKQEERENSTLIVFDIDKFKVLNLSYGREKGDALLHYVYHIFREELPEDQLCRNQSDHFVALIKNGSKDQIEGKIKKLIWRLETDIEKGSVVSFSLSFGVCSMKGIKDIRIAYTNAMIAKNTVKQNQIKKYAFFDDGLRTFSMQNQEMEDSFNHAIQNGEFHVFYQPKFDMRTRKLVESEALVRWIKPDNSIISPGKFIPCFESCGKIIQLDEMMLEMVCIQMKEMIAQGIDVKTVSVNLSRVHMNQPYIIEKIKNIIMRLEIDPSYLAFEITESALQENMIMKQIVKELHDMGCRVDMDDYGTGISSLHSLANNDFDVIKLDKSFIDKIGDPKMESVIKSTIDMALRLKLDLVAEGVETKEQADFLVENGCYLAQGYYYSKPVTKDEYINLLKNAATA